MTNFSRSMGGSDVVPSVTAPSRATESMVAVLIHATYRVKAPNDAGGGRWLRYATGWYRKRPSGSAATVNGFGRYASSTRPVAPGTSGTGTSSMQYRSRLGPFGAGDTSHGRCA